MAEVDVAAGARGRWVECGSRGGAWKAASSGGAR